MANPRFHIILAETKIGDEKMVVGLGTVFFQRNLSGWIAEIHDIVVDEKHRGKKIGLRIVKALLVKIQEFADSKDQKIKTALTSRPERIAANSLYDKLGFELVAAAKGENGTNLYRKTINQTE